MEGIVHLDPAGRGLASFRQAARPLDAGALRAAATDLAERAATVGIVSGFCARVGNRLTAETDGPPGALFLARILLALGVDVLLITDRVGLPLFAAGCDHWQLDRSILVEFPFDDETNLDAVSAARESSHTDRWVRDFFASAAGRLSHLIAIERPGPSHTLASLEHQRRAGEPPVARFVAAVPPGERDVCHNMRGQSIEAFTAKAHRLFEHIVAAQLPITTIGIGDGGNEIGMGSFSWEVLIEAMGRPSNGALPCRIATDFTLLSGVTNWAAYALALAVARLRGQQNLPPDCSAHGEQRLIEMLVQQAKAVDGLTLRAEATVDGLPLDVYLEPLAQMQNLLGFD